MGEKSESNNQKGNNTSEETNPLKKEGMLKFTSVRNLLIIGVGLIFEEKQIVEGVR